MLSFCQLSLALSGAHLLLCACVHVCSARRCREGRSWNKGSILKSTVDYVRRLQSQQQSLFAILERNRLLELRNQQLRNEVKVSSIVAAFR